MHKLISTFYRYLPFILLAITLGAICTEDAWGRAGGGGGFGGGGGGRGGYGGGSFSGGGNGGGGGGLALYFLIRLVFEHPVIGIPTLIVVGIFFYYTYGKAETSYTGRAIRNNTSKRRTKTDAQFCQEILKNDSEFDLVKFYTRIKSAFFKAQKAWCAQDLEPIRSFVSDGIYERWGLQIADQQREGCRDFMDNVTVTSLSLQNYEVNDHTEELTVRISANSTDYRVKLTDGAKIYGTDCSGVFTEYWTFLRRKDAKSLGDKKGLIEGHCPNCGAQVGINQAAKCLQCGSFLRSGEYDWVLTEITQESVYKEISNIEIPGVAKLQEIDKGFTPRMLEDRASIIFWRYISSLKNRDVNLSRGCCSDNLITQINDKISGEKRVFFNNCATGAVDTKGVIVGDDTDTAVVEVVWSGEKIMTTSSDKMLRSTKSVYRHLYVLKRASGVKSIQTNDVGSAHCPNCGAPENCGDNGECKYCGTLLNDGSRNWVLDDVFVWSGKQATEILTQLSENNKAEASGMAYESKLGAVDVSAYSLLAWLVQLSVCDGEISPREELILTKTAKSRHIPYNDLKHMIAAAVAGNLQTGMPQSDKEARHWLRALVRLAWADGKITREEMVLIKKVAKRLEFADSDIKAIIKEEKAVLLSRD